MTKERLFLRIACIASIEYQRQFFVHGTATSYILLDELIETTEYEAERQLARDNRFTDVEARAVSKFVAVTNEKYLLVRFDDPDSTNSYLVEDDPAMCAIREAAAECLRECGKQYEFKELLSS